MRLLISLPIILLFFSSAAQESSFPAPQMPTGFSFDLDQDSIADFSIQYSSISTLDIPASHESISGTLSPLHQNELLWADSKGILLLNPLDSIRQFNSENEVWRKDECWLVSIGASKNVWQKEWNVLSDTHLYIGVKVIKNGLVKIGWIQLLLSKKDGSVQLMAHQLSDQKAVQIQEQFKTLER